jgi:hypothetical protein
MTTFKEYIAADIKNIFLNSSDFAEKFTNSRTAVDIDAIFDNAFITIIDDVESSTPAIVVADVDIPGVRHSDTFTRLLDSVVYKVWSIQPDGTGMTTILLTQD